MFILILTWVVRVALCLGALAVLLIILVTIDLSFYLYKGYRHAGHKAKHRRKQQIIEAKERIAHEGFFEESYVTVFDPYGVPMQRIVWSPTEQAREYYRQMDRLADDLIFYNTKDL